MSVPQVSFSVANEPVRDVAPGGRYQAALSLLFLLCASLMVSQYTFYKYGPAKVIISPIGRHTQSNIAYYAKPKDGVPPEDIQKPGLFILNWAEFDQCAYRLHSTKSIPPAEMLGALLFVLALPTVLFFGRRVPWPRWPQWFYMLIGCMALLGAGEFKEGVKELIQWGLIMIATWWLAAVAIADGEQARRFGRWLVVLTVGLLLMAVREYVVYVLMARPAQPLLVRASLQSRSAYCGLMAMLLTMLFARGLWSSDRRWTIGAVAAVLVGASTMMTLSGLIALYVGCLVVAGRHSLRALGYTALCLPLAVGLFGCVSRGHLGILRESASFYRMEGGRATGVEKRYLEMAAALNMFNGAQDDTLTKPDPNAKPGEEAQAIPVGSRSAATFGVGPGLNYQSVIGRYYNTLDNPKKQEPDTYTLYLLLACQLGIFGAVAWAWILFDGATTASHAAARLRDDELRALALGVQGALFSLLVFSVWGTLLVRGTGMMIFTLLALAWRLERSSELTAQVPVVDAPAFSDVQEIEPEPAPEPDNAGWEDEHVDSDEA
ncbi:MAG: hypothetical protein HZB16_09270 [Armatimonadetes bacterium]|nr:hypothetical protein [Armatimonadota bacterium]